MDAVEVICMGKEEGRRFGTAELKWKRAAALTTDGSRYLVLVGVELRVVSSVWTEGNEDAKER